jgi:hypothetical protein
MLAHAFRRRLCIGTGCLTPDETCRQGRYGYRASRVVVTRPVAMSYTWPETLTFGASKGEVSRRSTSPLPPAIISRSSPSPSSTRAWHEPARSCPRRSASQAALGSPARHARAVPAGDAGRSSVRHSRSTSPVLHAVFPAAVTIRQFPPVRLFRELRRHPGRSAAELRPRPRERPAQAAGAARSPEPHPWRRLRRPKLR